MWRAIGRWCGRRRPQRSTWTAAVAQQQVLREEMNARKAELTQTKLQQRTQIALAAAELEFARATQRLAKLNLDYTDIKAPVNGRIGESNIFVGGLATANSTNPLTLLSPLDPIQVKVKSASANTSLHPKGSRRGGAG